ncbi:Protein FAM50A [Varanus komodoensis]|nr:Protein FAM50A [Varanus komodoensis]
MRKVGLDESPAGIKIAGRNINNLRYADDTTLMVESEEGLKSLLIRVKEENPSTTMAQYKGAASEAGRALQLMKKRERQREHMEQMRQRIAEIHSQENIMKSNIDKKFSAHYDAVEAELKSSTVGLVTLNDMKAKQEALVKEREKQLAKKEQSKELQLKLERMRERERKQEQKRKISSLSFTLEEEEEEEDDGEEEEDEEAELEREELPPKKKKLGKNPDVDTSFLPDRDREEEENRLREELRQEWEAKQEKIKSEEIEITFSYWDGSGHRRTVKMKKGNTIQQFLQKALEILRKDFSELRVLGHEMCEKVEMLGSVSVSPCRSAGVEQLMYIKEDLIIPHHHSFYDFIVTKARGKSGPLFNFDVHDDVRLLSDATVEKDESHAGKVVLRSWYEKNKHIFPASRWEPYDPEKKWDKYTVGNEASWLGWEASDENGMLWRRHVDSRQTPVHLYSEVRPLEFNGVCKLMFRIANEDVMKSQVTPQKIKWDHLIDQVAALLLSSGSSKDIICGPLQLDSIPMPRVRWIGELLE